MLLKIKDFYRLSVIFFMMNKIETISGKTNKKIGDIVN